MPIVDAAVNSHMQDGVCRHQENRASKLYAPHPIIFFLSQTKTSPVGGLKIQSYVAKCSGVQTVGSGE